MEGEHTFSRCRITIGNALQGGVKKHRSAKKHYKGNVVSSGCSTYSFHVRFFFFCFEYLQAISMERESESLFSKRWKMKFLFKIISIYSYFGKCCYVVAYIYISL